jgi:N utilization substance protein A
MDTAVAAALLENNIDFIEDFLALSEEGLAALEGINAEQIAALRQLIEEYVEIVEEEGGEEFYEDEEGAEGEAAPEAEEAAETGEETGPEEAASDAEAEEYECPECGAKITVDMTNCPNCGIGLSFEFEEE